MSRFWEIIIYSRGRDRFYCFPFLFLFRLITPFYQFFSRRHLKKRAGQKSKEWRAKVISVGNITVGGSGKTPIVMALAQRLILAGKKVAIVHSGYGRRSKKHLMIGPNRSADYTIDDTGDEVMMMARLHPDIAYAVGADKKKCVIKADREFSPDYIIIDDGFQRLDIDKDIDIVLAGAPLPFFGTSDKAAKKLLRLFPAGILRENIDAMQRADAVFSVLPRESEMLVSPLPVRNFDWRLELTGILEGGDKHDLSFLKDRKPLVFAGIGSYPRLLGMLNRLDIEIAGDYGFGDHYRYDKIDLVMLRDMAAGVKADCYLTTAKDLVKLPHREWDKPLYQLVLEAVPADPVLLDQLLGLKNGF